LDSLEDNQDWINRLKIIEGQVRGLQNMVEDSRSCSELLILISAMEAALHKLGVIILNIHMQEEFQLIIALDNPAQKEKRIKKMFALLSRNLM
jgi:DNA-binding FrmR family transcriptional regulator